MHLGIDASLSEQDALVIIRWIALQQQMFSEQLYLTIDQCGFMYSRCPVNQCLVINAGLSRSSHVEGEFGDASLLPSGDLERSREEEALTMQSREKSKTLSSCCVCLPHL